MNRMLKRALGRMVLWQKFTVIGALALCLLAVPLYLYLGVTGEDLERARRELQGAAPIGAVHAVVRAVQQHRTLTAGAANGVDSMRAVQPQARAAASAALDRVAGLLAGRDPASATTTELAAIRDAWQELVRRAGTPGVMDAELLDAHDALIARLHAFVRTLAEDYGLAFDSEPAYHHLVSGLTDRAPALAETVARMQTLGVKVLSRRALWADDSMAFAQAVDGLDARIGALEAALGKAMALEPVRATVEREASRAIAAAREAGALIDAKILSAPKLTEPPEPLMAALAPSIDAQYALIEALGQALERGLATRVEALAAGRRAAVAALLAMAAVIAALGWLVVRSITVPMRRAVAVAEAVARGDLDCPVAVEGSDESARMLAALASMQQSLRERIERERRQHTEVVRIKQGLDHVETNVMIADANYDIVYLNHAIRRMLAEAEDEIRKDLPGFRADAVLGANIDQFHRDPAHQRAVLDRLEKAHRARIRLGGRSFELVVNPVRGADDERVGTVVEWQDVTEKLKAIEAEKLKAQEMRLQLEAVGRAQAVIAFLHDGTILEANELFCRTMGVSADEIRGRHHRMFVDPEWAASEEYRRFWEQLAQGRYQAGRFARRRSDGSEVWLQALYCPITDLEGKVVKVVKYATDITDQVLAERAMSDAVEQTRQVVQAARGGDLTARIPTEDKHGEVEELCSGVNELLDTMAGILGDLRRVAAAVSGAAAEIAAGNMDLSQRTERQAASLEEAASSIEELTSTVKQNAENARQANQLAVGASEVASRGGQVVEQVVATMREINESSGRIQEIIGVIDGIAFQTNILALNAAVEAARAGEQGRGFAVVASEVRALAQRSAAAAKEIKQLISDSVDKVEGGSELVSQAGQTMAEILQAVRRVTDIMGEISAASQEQSVGIEQVNQTVAQMDEVTQQNAALVEEASAAAKSLEDQARELAETVSRFRTGDDGMPAPLEPARPTRKDDPPVPTGSPPRRRASDAGGRRGNGAATAVRPAEIDGEDAMHWAEF